MTTKNRVTVDVKTQIGVPGVVVQVFADLSGDVNIRPDLAVKPEKEGQWPEFLGIMNPPVAGYLGKLIWNDRQSKTELKKEVLRLLTDHTKVPESNITEILFAMDAVVPEKPLK